MVSATFSLLFITVFTAMTSAFPLDPNALGLPDDAPVSSIALDDNDSTIYAYNDDGTLYGKYPVIKSRADDNVETLSKRADMCSNLSVQEMKTIPGWSKVTDYVVATYGKGDYKLVTNPEEYLDRPAQVCVQPNPVKIKKKGKTSCTTQQSTSEGWLIGTDGKVSLEIWTGYTTTGTYTVSKSSTLGHSLKLGASFSIPEVLTISGEKTVTTEFKNELSSSFSTAVNTQQKQTLTVDSKSGQKCYVEFENTTCNVEGTGQIRVYATGWAWFNFHSKTKGHYKWAVNLDKVIPNIDERSTFTQFKGAINGKSVTKYRGVCK